MREPSRNESLEDLWAKDVHQAGKPEQPREDVGRGSAAGLHVAEQFAHECEHARVRTV